MKTIFVDTNLFLQCKKLEELPWKDISDGEDLLLLIPRPVQEEIDRLKHDGNSRRAARARKINSLFRDLLLTSNNKKTINQKNPLVEITFTLDPQISNENYKTLDASKIDNQIILEALNYRGNTESENVFLLTHDTNPMLTAKNWGLPFIPIPDNWLLPPEPDPQKKELLKLQERLLALEKKYPTIGISVWHVSQEVKGLDVLVSRHEDLPANEVNQLLKEVKQKNPMKTQFFEENPKMPDHLKLLNSISFGKSYKYEKPKVEEIEEYKNEKYPEWIDKVGTFIENLPNRLELTTRCYELTVSLSNTGRVPAENLVVEFRLVGGLLLFNPLKQDKEDEKEQQETFPLPPIAPQGEWKVFDTFGCLDLHNSIFGSIKMKPVPFPYLGTAPRKRDRHLFYWKSQSDEKWESECEEFRHKETKPKLFTIPILIPKEENIVKGALRCIVTAKNLPEPIEYNLPITVSYKDEDSYVKAKNYVEEN